MDAETVKALAAIIAAAAALWGTYVFFSNSRLQRAKWLFELYEKFYESDDLKAIRETLDCEAGNSPHIEKLITDESAEFTDYLNFFEFVAVLKKLRQLTTDEIEGLFRYYLDCLQRSGQVRSYIAKKGYEHLDELLKGRANPR